MSAFGNSGQGWRRTELVDEVLIGLSPSDR